MSSLSPVVTRLARAVARVAPLPWIAVAGLGCGILGDAQLETPNEASERPAVAQSTSASRAAPQGAAAAASPDDEALREEQARDWAETLDSPPLLWTFRAAAPVSGSPAVGADGSVYVSTVEGYVHALSPDGVFRWSYTVTGIPIGAPRVDADGVVYLATNARRVYALTPDGHLRWVAKTPARVATELAWAPPGHVYYPGRDRRLYALTAWGKPLWNRRLGSKATTPPAPLPHGIVAVATERPELWLFQGAARAARLALPGPARQAPMAAQDHWLVTCDDELISLSASTREVTWRRPARQVTVSSDGRQVVAVGASELSWLDVGTGEPLASAALPGSVSGRPAVTPDGLVLVPLVTGELAMVTRDGSPAKRTAVSGSPTWAPVHQERTHRVVVASGGVVGVIAVPAAARLSRGAVE